MDKTQSMISEIDQKQNLSSVVKNLNTYTNIFYFEKHGIDMNKVLRWCVAKLLKNKERIPSGGYFDLISFIDNIKKNKKSK